MELREKGEGIKQNKNKNKKTQQPHRHRQQYGDYQRETGCGKGKEGIEG